MSEMAKRNIRYIRCIKPNLTKQPEFFDNDYVASQVRSSGLLDLVSIKKSGYVMSYKIARFLDLYAILLDGQQPKTKETMMNFFTSVSIAEDEYVLGDTMLFIKAAKTVF
jgi:myosin heavy subunit